MVIEFVCETCGQHCVRRRSPANTKTPPKYCGQKCHGIARRGSGHGRIVNTTFDCQSCGKHVETYRSPSNTASTPARFCSLACVGKDQRGSANPSYSGGKHAQSAGYVMVLRPEHPNADVRGYVLEHRLVMERELGRKLDRGEVVHHINGVKNDNRPENLMLLSSQAEHARIHALARGAEVAQ